MYPNGPALDYPMADLLLPRAESERAVDCRPCWTNENISEATNQGPYVPAKELET